MPLPGGRSHRASWPPTCALRRAHGAHGRSGARCANAPGCAPCAASPGRAASGMGSFPHLRIGRNTHWLLGIGLTPPSRRHGRANLAEERFSIRNSAIPSTSRSAPDDATKGGRPRNGGGLSSHPEVRCPPDSKKKPRPEDEAKRLKRLVGRVGIEPTTKDSRAHTCGGTTCLVEETGEAMMSGRGL